MITPVGGNRVYLYRWANPGNSLNPGVINTGSGLSDRTAGGAGTLAEPEPAVTADRRSLAPAVRAGLAAADRVRQNLRPNPAIQALNRAYAQHYGRR